MTVKKIEIVSNDGRTFFGEFTLWEEAPDDPDQVQLDLHLVGEEFSAIAETFFDAMVNIRRELEYKGLRPKCFGACKDVYPSPMIRNMGNGEKAYQLKLGSPAKMEDLDSIFSSVAEITPSSVKEQEEFYRRWLKSLQ